MRTIIIGDVHGCLDELVVLVATCGGITENRFVLVGDLVAKGPDSIGVIQWARENKVAAVLGNHDDHVLTARAQLTAAANGDVDAQVGARKSEGGKKPKHSPKPEHFKIAETLPQADWAWLSARPLWLQFQPGDIGGDPITVVHGGLVPEVPLQEQARRHLLALRSITDEGKPSTRIEGAPWASRWTGPDHVVFGHDAVRGLQQHPFATGLDTGCVYGGRLTALVLPERQLIHVPAARAYSSL